MATVTIPSEDRTLTDPSEIGEFLGKFGVWYRRHVGDSDLDGATNDAILEAFAEPIAELKAEGGYVTADVININANTPGLEEMLAKFDKEHTHAEDEIRFIVGGNGLFHINPEAAGPVFRIDVTEGDMILVPRGTKHWFHLCSDRHIKAIRLFKDPAGWTPEYTSSGVDTDHAPLCFGPDYIEPAPEIDSVI